MNRSNRAKRMHKFTLKMIADDIQRFSMVEDSFLWSFKVQIIKYLQENTLRIKLSKIYIFIYSDVKEKLQNAINFT